MRKCFIPVCLLALTLVDAGTVFAQVVSIPVTRRTAGGIIMAGHIAGFTAEQQGLVDPLGLYQLSSLGLGQLDASTTLNSITFANSTCIEAERDPATSFSPGAGGASGSAPADFGITLAVPFGSGEAAIRDLRFSITGTTAFDQTSSTNSQRTSVFTDSQDLSVTITGGTLDYSIRSSLFPSVSGSKSLVGLTGDFLVNGTVLDFLTSTPERSINLSALIDIPFTVQNTNDSRLAVRLLVSGDRTAVPEPTTLGLLVLPAIALLKRRRVA